MKRPNRPSHRNLVDLIEFVDGVRHPELRFTVSSRGIRPDIDLMVYLKIFFMYVDVGQVQSVFGHPRFPSLLYGGRVFDTSNALTDEHLQAMERHGIGLSLTLTNHFFDEGAYRQTLELLERHHRPGNSVVCVSDDLARRIRTDFPDYALNASVIKNLSTANKIRAALNLYDRVILPMPLNDDDAFLAELPQKDRITLFGNAGCAYTCPARTCYYGISQYNQGRSVTVRCSRGWMDRPELGMVHFDLAKLHGMGFRSFKLIPRTSDQERMEAVARAHSSTARSPPLACSG